MSLTLTCTPQSGVPPFVSTFDGVLTDASGMPIANASVYFQSFFNGTWVDMFSQPFITDSNGAYSVPVELTLENGWVQGIRVDVRSIFYGDGINGTAISNHVLLTMEAVAGALTFDITPTHGVLPWNGSIMGQFKDYYGAGIGGVTIDFENLDPVNGWTRTGITAVTDSTGAYNGIFPFASSGGWIPNETEEMRAVFYGDFNYAPAVSNHIMVTMDGGVGAIQINGPFAVSVGQTVTLNATISGGTPPYSYMIAWGDGTGTGVQTSQGAVTASHSYSAAGTFTIEISVQYVGIKSTTATITDGVVPLDWLTPLAIGVTAFVSTVLVVKVARGGKKKKRRR